MAENEPAETNVSVSECGFGCCSAAGRCSISTASRRLSTRLCRRGAGLGAPARECTTRAGRSTFGRSMVAHGPLSSGEADMGIPWKFRHCHPRSGRLQQDEFKRVAVGDPDPTSHSGTTKGTQECGFEWADEASQALILRYEWKFETSDSVSAA
jgi:hypothetical protein